MGCYKPQSIQQYCYYHDALNKERNLKRRQKRQNTIKDLKEQIVHLKQQIQLYTHLQPPPIASQNEKKKIKDPSESYIRH